MEVWGYGRTIVPGLLQTPLNPHAAYAGETELGASKSMSTSKTQSKSIILGTAGHVDHGKTTLIKALTGIDTDRLKEEQERGMTIDIGFASLTLPNGQSVGIVDVPGHERFIKNMLAGAGGVDVALLVIAADESVMPQTTEHLEILQLLEVRRGVVALTKAGMVDADWIEFVKEDVRKALSDTFLAGSPIVPVDSLTGHGLPELLDAIQTACEDVEARDASGPFRLPIDRVFTSTGFGTIVTGTLVAGTVRVGDPVELLPSGLHSRVRGIQVHGHKEDTAEAGTRVAMNLAGLEVAELGRGDICARPGALKAANLFDLRLTLLGDAGKPLRNGARVRLHVGTAELIGRLTLLDRDELRPGDEAFAQFRSETPAAAARGDRYVIRSYSPMITIGGGVVLDPAARRHRRYDQAVLDALETSSRGTPGELVEQALRQSVTGITTADLSKLSGIPDIQPILDSLRTQAKAVEVLPGKLIHTYTVSQHLSKIRDVLEQFQLKNALRAGMPKEELRISAAKAFDSRGFAGLLAYLEEHGEVCTSGTLAHLPSWEVTLSPAQQAGVARIIGELQRTGVNVPSAEELVRISGLPAQTTKEILDLLIHRGEIIKAADDLFFCSSAIEDAEAKLRDYLSANEKITVSEFRDLIGTSRKYALPLLEYFDSRKITRRQGDERIMVG